MTNPCLDIPSCVWIAFLDLDHFIVKCPYNKGLLESFEWQAMNKKWNPENKTWEFEADCFHDVVELMKEYYR